jgi:ParB family chromosome partitioning protein
MKKGNKKKAFDAPRTSTFVYDPNDLVIIGHDTKDGPLHPLYATDCNEPIDETFQESVFRHGVDTDIIITKWEGKACVVEGRTRVRAARVANKRRAKEGLPLIRIGCKVVSGTEAKLAAKKIRANNVRKVMTVMQKAEDAQFLIDQGMPIEDVAVELGVKTAQTVKEWIAVLGATADVRKAVETGKIGATAAAKIAKLEGRDAQREALATAVANGGGSLVEAKRAVRKAKREAEGKTGDGMGVVGRKLQRQLLDVAAAKAEDANEILEDTTYYQGFADALRVILGEETQDTRAELAVLGVTKTLDEAKAA